MRVESLGDRETRVLLTLLHLHARNGRVTIREVAAGAGLPLTTTYTMLRRLEQEGLVRQEYGTQGTLRPGVELVEWAA